VLSGALRRERLSAHRPLPRSLTLCLDLRSASDPYGARRVGLPGAAPPPHLVLTGAHLGSATALRRTVRGHREVSRPQQTRCRSCCTRPHEGDRASSSVWWSHVGAPAGGNEDSTRCQGRTALGLTHSGKKLANSAPRERLSLDNGGPHKG